VGDGGIEGVIGGRGQRMTGWVKGRIHNRGGGGGGGLRNDVI
jgi:hypothetical protein